MSGAKLGQLVSVRLRQGAEAIGGRWLDRWPKREAMARAKGARA